MDNRSGPRRETSSLADIIGAQLLIDVVQVHLSSSVRIVVNDFWFLTSSPHSARSKWLHV